MYDDEYFMKRALCLAKAAYRDKEIPVGAVIVRNNQILAEAYNQKDTKKIVTKHAEIIAIEQANITEKDWRLCGATIYVTMEPCPMCASAIQQARIKRLVYGCSSNIRENTVIINKILKNPKYNHSVEITSGVLEKECSELIKNFFKLKRQKNKFHV